MMKPDSLVPDLQGAAGAAALIAEMARQATEPTLLALPTAGLGDGLPPAVPALFDRQKQAVVPVLSHIEAARQAPARRAGVAKVTTLESFIALVQRHKDEHSAIFAETGWPGPKLTAVIDYHTADHTPRWGRHRVVYDFPLTDELRAWIGANGKLMEQSDFAAFLEEHAAELTAPFDGERSEYERLFKEKMAVPSELIALSRSLEVFVGAKVKRAERLQTGERTVEFVEEHTNGRGEKVDIPGVFMVAVPAFVDGAPVRMPARLRYRIAAGSIHWSYALYRWEHWLREAVQRDLRTAGDETGLPTFEGAPEA